MGDAVGEPAEMAGHVRVPRVAVEEVGAGVLRGDGEVDPQHVERRRGGQGRPRLDRSDVDPRIRRPGRAEAPDADVDAACDLPGQILDVNARASVHLGRVFARDECDPHLRVAPRAGLHAGREPVGYVARIAAEIAWVFGLGFRCSKWNTPEFSIQSRPDSARHISQIHRAHSRLR